MQRTEPSRRQFLAMLGAAAATGILPVRSAAVEEASTSALSALIDVHHHFFPPAFRAVALDSYRDRERSIASEWTPQRDLEDMDKAGVKAAVLSVTTPGIWHGDAQEARSLARECNDYAAKLASDHPRTFGFFAAIPLPDAEGSMREIAHALDVLKADGIGLMTNYGDKWPGDPAYATVLDELNRRKAVVFFHPMAANCCRNLVPDVPTPLIEFPHDTARAITSLLYSGSLARLRNIRFIFAHAGGTIPMLAGRISQLGTLFGSDKKVPKGVEYELKRLYYEIANSANRPAITALMNLVPASQILFGSDYPFVPIDATRIGMSKVGLAQRDLRAISRGNSIGLLPRFSR